MLALAIGLVHIIARRFSMNPDGISYLDIADAYRTLRFSDALNATWSPLYSWVLALAHLLIRPSPAQESTMVHGVNLVLFLLSLLSFEFLLRGLLPKRTDEPISSTDHGIKSPSAATRRLIVWTAYLLYFWGALVLVDLSLVTPDILVCGLAYLAFGILVRWWKHPVRCDLLAALGCTLGLGYLAKAAMFPVALLTLILVALHLHRTRCHLARTLCAAITLAVIAGPFIALLSSRYGRPTFGETGRIAWAWHNNDVPQHGQWQGEPQGSGQPLHAPRVIVTHPRTLEFGEPVPGTYALTYELAYWYGGLRTTIRPLRAVRLLVENLVRHWWLLATLVLGLVIVFCVADDRPQVMRDVLGQWPLILLCVTVLGMFAVVALEPRYVAAFVVVIHVAVLIGLAASCDTSVRTCRAARGLITATAIFAAAPVLYHTVWRTIQAVHMLRPSAESPDWRFARELTGAGVQPGDRVGTIGSGQGAYWARLAGVRITAEVSSRDSEDFWAAPAERQREVTAAMFRSGVRAVVAAKPPDSAHVSGWIRLKSGAAVRLLTAADTSAARAVSLRHGSRRTRRDSCYGTSARSEGATMVVPRASRASCLAGAEAFG